MALPTPKRIKGLLELMDEALEMDAAKEAVLRLGLKADNTAADRAKALGFDVDTPLYHGRRTDYSEIKEPTNLFESFYTTKTPSYASEFANHEGGNIMPLLGKKKPSNPYHLYDGSPLTTESKDHYMREFIKGYNAPEMPLGQSWDDYLKVNSGNREINYLNNKRKSLESGKFFGFSQPRSFEAKKEAIKKSGYDGVTAGDADDFNLYLNPSSDVRSKFAKFNPKKAGIPLLTGGAGGAFMSSNLLAAPSSEQELKAPDKSDLTRNIGGLLPFMADSYKYVANEGGLLGEILYGGGAKALDNLSYGDTPMKPKGHLPFRTPTNESILNLMELLQL